MIVVLSQGLYEFQGETDPEKDAVAKLARFLQPGAELRYEGVKGKMEPVLQLRFSLVGARDLNERPPWPTEVLTEVAGQPAELLISARSDSGGGSLRNDMYFGGQKLTFQRVESGDGAVKLVFAAVFCKQCGAPTSGLAAVQSLICDECAKTCNHSFRRGVVRHSGGLGAGYYCTRCCRVLEHKGQSGVVPLDAFVSDDGLIPPESGLGVDAVLRVVPSA